MTEKEEAVRLANAVLEKPYIDPDGDISVLARQFLRAREEIDAMRAALQRMVAEWDKMTRYGSPLAKAANENLKFARATLANFTVPLEFTESTGRGSS
jgi:hypothetical protein